MKKISFLVLITILSISKAITQQNFPPFYEIKTDTAVNVTLGNSYWQMLEDSEGKWTIDEVSRPPIADQFHANTTKTNGILEVDYSINTFWFRYRFKNNMKHEARIIIPKNVSYGDLYTLASDGKWNHKTTGTIVPWSKRDDLKRITTLTYSIQPGEELLFYERNHFNYNSNTPDFFGIKFGFTDKVIQAYYDENDSSILPSFIFGVFLLAALFNLYFFLIVHQRVYLIFSLMLFFRGFSRFLYANEVFFKENPTVRLESGNVFSLLFLIFLIHFLRYFLEISKHFPRWDKYLIGLNIYNILISILALRNIIVVELSHILGPAIVVLSILITLILFLRSQIKAVGWAVLATLPIICIMSIPSFLILLKFLNEYTGIPIPSLLKWIWVNDRFAVLEQIGLIWLLIFFSWNLFQRYQQLQKTIAAETLAKERLAKEKEIERNQLIAHQKVQLEKDVEERTAELMQSLENLKATQAQLIQSEKMASLGELTAGIAHEIQNPLNFVNNFSEVSTELVDEMKNELSLGKSEAAIEIANDLKDNLTKINHHGLRASNIVKGMLEHSRASTGIKQPTDINALCEEYVKLSYQAMRSRDQQFKCDIKLDLDRDLPKINVVTQDISRVILNLVNNAFQAVNEKSNNLAGLNRDERDVKNLRGLSETANAVNLVGSSEAQAIPNRQGYQPLVTISTKNLADKIEIKISDKGSGIPGSIKDKIFQPFFTTKPPGQGTGLGLSLAYDIVKAHNGNIAVDSSALNGTSFTIQIPIL